MPKYTRSVCVFCGSRPGARPAYTAAAQGMGRMLAERGWRLVYGAGDVGLMGEVARAAQAAGGETFGVIPVHLLGKEVGKRDISTFVITETMHERKKVMYMNSDAIVVLPGGAGTLDELFEVVTWRQIGLHSKPIYLLNTEGYWNPLLAMAETVIAEGFAERSLAGYMVPVASLDELETRLTGDFG
ncbi:TIGR00730 family Rossman fold protein [Frigidibacter albus]|uniref:Cytokinin riboside 5'-monophosphate phosphoribohydrolase n=1 Tax=Frigidibacter albus TaxID=1465486 RepID=A0A6L8VFX6_9RHOB|nr:TIGR00730 family Rossman fold protein [Frigidibacter albus]MZQ88199.1 TIGR00730 family Rossman fold protein [Frigidibacter albus]NBE30127.1 TIGR00730 family Rossman fold protein [Frigidibacter albus]GGH46856.1 cytokinin riboside 5'-monophosphate phosphoribohydrolase [Frigidibacter albus]